MQNRSESFVAGGDQSSPAGSSRNNGSPAARSSPEMVPPPTAARVDDQIASSRQQTPVDPPEVLRQVDPPDFSREHLAEIHGHELHAFPGEANNGNSGFLTNSSDTAQFISNIRDRELQAIAMEKMGPYPTPVRLEEILRDDGPPMLFLPTNNSVPRSPSKPHHATSSAQFISHTNAGSAGRRRVSIDPPAITPDLGISSAQSPYVPTAEATPIPGSNRHLIQVQATSFTTENQRITFTSMTNPSAYEDADHASRYSAVSASNNSENAMRITYESNQVAVEREPQDNNQEEDIESSTDGSKQSKPPSLWEVHKKKLICGGSIFVVFAALVGILAAVLGGDGEGENIQRQPPPNPSFISAPSSSPISDRASSPTESCKWVVVNIIFDDYPGETLWGIQKVGPTGDSIVRKTFDEEDVVRSPIESMCLEDGQYNFTIRDRGGDGLCCGPGKEGSYKVYVDGEVLAQGGQFREAETTLFEILEIPNPACKHQVEVNIVFDAYPQETSWDIQKIEMTGDSTLITRYNATHGEVNYAGITCLKDEGQYRFTVYDSDGDGMGSEPERKGQYSVTLYGQVIAQGSAFESSESTMFDVHGPTSFPSQLPSTNPTQSPTASKAPTIRVMTSTPTFFCEWFTVNVAFDSFAEEISWDLHDINIMSGDGALAEYAAENGEAFKTQSTCLPKGFYRFTIYDSHGDGLGRNGVGQYNITSTTSENGMAMVIAQGGNFGFNERTFFSIPLID